MFNKKVKYKLRQVKLEQLKRMIHNFPILKIFYIYIS
jgi:hypothetical protein